MTTRKSRYRSAISVALFTIYAAATASGQREDSLANIVKWPEQYQVPNLIRNYIFQSSFWRFLVVRILNTFTMLQLSWQIDIPYMKKLQKDGLTYDTVQFLTKNIPL